MSLTTLLLRASILLIVISSNATDSGKCVGQDSTRTDQASADWPMFGGSPNRNQYNAATGFDWDFRLPSNSDPEGKNILWTAELGSQTYGSIAVSGGKVFVGTNNYGKRRPKYQDDRGVLLCFEEDTGKFLWQLTRAKIRPQAQGRANDVPYQGIVSVPCIEGDRLWIVTNRAELMCVDTEGFYDDENDGTQSEEDVEQQDADIVWSLDMMKGLDVFPHSLAASSPVVYGDLVFALTSNGVDEGHVNIPSPDAPSFIAVNKQTGKVVWQDSRPGKGILHGQWSSPAIGVVNGQPHVYFAAGDGWLYAFTAETGELVWKFDLNPKANTWELGWGSRNSVLGTPVFFENSVVIATGTDPELGLGVAHVYRIDATKRGDVSAEIGERGKPGEANPNSAMIWMYGGVDEDGSVTGKAGNEIFGRSLSTASIANDMVFIPDLRGWLHCIDWKTGKRLWAHDLMSGLWGSAMYVDNKILIGLEFGNLMVVDVSGEKATVVSEHDTLQYNSVYSTPIIANDKLFVLDRRRLYVVKLR